MCVLNLKDIKLFPAFPILALQRESLLMMSVLFPQKIIIHIRADIYV